MMICKPTVAAGAVMFAVAAMGADSCGDTSKPKDDNPSAVPADKSKTKSSTPKAVTFGQQSASGEAAIAQTEGTIRNPEIIRVRVKTVPPLKASVTYTLICATGGSAGSKSGQFTASSPIDRKINIPNGRPDSCDVSANAQLEAGGDGTITIKLRGRER